MFGYCSRCDKCGYFDKCGKCKLQYYCSRECQLEDLESHESECNIHVNAMGCIPHYYETIKYLMIWRKRRFYIFFAYINEFMKVKPDWDKRRLIFNLKQVGRTFHIINVTGEIDDEVHEDGILWYNIEIMNPNPLDVLKVSMPCRYKYNNTDYTWLVDDLKNFISNLSDSGHDRSLRVLGSRDEMLFKYYGSSQYNNTNYKCMKFYFFTKKECLNMMRYGNLKEQT